MKWQSGFLNARQAGTQAQVIPVHRDIYDPSFRRSAFDLTDQLCDALRERNASLRDSGN
jgi:hypothetical protein